MTDKLILCPLKETMVYESVCHGKCTHDPAECERLRTSMKEQKRYCIDCKHFGKRQPCRACMEADPDHRERPFWKATPVSQTAGYMQAVKGDARKLRQERLF